MKSKHLLLTLLLALLVPWAAMGQETLTVYDGTTTNRNVPMYVYYFDAFAHSQYVIPATDLAEMVGGTITSLHYYTSYTSAYTTDKTVTFRLAEVEGTTLSSFADVTSATVVYNGYVEFALVDGKCETTITFSTPYTYNGGNLLVDCQNDAKGTYKSIYFYGQSVDYSSAVYGNNSSATPTTGGTTQQFIPKTTFTYTPGATDCEMPSAIAVNNVTHEGAVVTWEGDGNKWNLRYKASTDEDYTIVNDLTETSYTLSNLDGNTAYSVGVQTVCSGSTSFFRSTSFTTLNPCAAPTNLQVSDITPSSAMLTWTAGYQETSWTVKYKKSTETEWAEENVSGTPTLSLTGLEGLTTYNVQVYNCENYVSANFTTAASFPYAQDFSASGIPTGWTQYTGLLEDVMGGTALTSTTYGWSNGTSNGVLDGNNIYANIYSTGCKKWIVTPAIPMESGARLTFDVAYTAYSGTAAAPQQTGTDDKFVVLASTDNMATWTILRQWDNAGSEYVLNDLTPTTLSLAFDMAEYAGTYLNIAFYAESTVSNADNNIHVDNVVFELIPACEKPLNVAVNYENGTTATVTWEGTATSYNIDVNGTVTEGVTSPYTLEGLELATTYEVMVQANCGSDLSEWSNPVSFTTDLCMPENMCELTFALTDSYGDGWNGAYIDVVDVATNISVAHMTNQNLNGTSGSGTNELNTLTLAVCDGRELQFVWHSGSYDTECSYVITDINEEVIFEGSGAMSEPVNYTVNCTVIACKKPANLTAGTPGKHEVELSWTEKGEATMWQICLNDDEDNLIDVTENPYTLTGLAADSTYTVKVRAYCSDEEQSNWSNTVSFTTEEACPMDINNVTVNYITNNEATVIWGGTHDNYQLQYRTAENSQIVVSEGSYYDDFENGIDNWTLIDADGDGNNWASHINTGSQNLEAHSGLGVAFSQSYNGSALTPDNYLVTPKVQLGQTLTFWACAQDANWAAEHFGVAVSTTVNNDPDAFTMVQEWTMTAKSVGGKTGATRSGNRDAGTYYQYTVDLSAYSGMGYIALRHFDCTDYFYLNVDDFQYGEVQTVVTPAGEWMTVETADLAAAITGLEAGTTYEYQVRGYCADEDSWTDWTSMDSFTTLDVCATPENLVIVPGANSAILTWEGVQDSYYVLWADAASVNSGTYTPQIEEVQGTYFEMESLESGVQYYVNVYGICSDTQLSDYLQGDFTTALLWTDPNTWGEPEYPGESNPEPVTIPDNMTVVIPAGNETNPTVIEVTEITMGTNSNIIIEENAELIYEGTDVDQGIDVTMSMTIAGVSKAKDSNNSGYRLIASPIYQTMNVEDCGLTANYYGMDLYSFDASYPQAEWRNYKTGNNFSDLEIGKGYLYYNSETVFVTFAGQTVPSNVTYHIDLAYSENAWNEDWKGLNLIGNPFTCKATPSKSFYVLSEAGDEIMTTVSTEAYVAPMKGFFVVANGAGDQCDMNKYVENTGAGSGAGGPVIGPDFGALNIKLNHNQSLTDVAVVKFGKGENLRKVQLNENHTKLYIPVDGIDYAVANTDSNVGEMPVNFKAEYNGSYTMSFANDNVEFSYLHLIDNMTGNDVDLLVNPSYSFNAQTTDYASRFRLVYATGSSVDGDSFGFINGMGNLCIFGIEGEATLQVMDVLGHVISSDQFSGSFEQKLNVAPGVYMIRLINGNDVKVQKIVVK